MLNELYTEFGLMVIQLSRKGKVWTLEHGASFVGFMTAFITKIAALIVGFCRCGLSCGQLPIAAKAAPTGRVLCVYTHQGEGQI